MLSVIVPIYNEEKYIAKCINSMLEQDYPKDDLEIILVDGMSKDKTREIVSTYTAKYPFIRLIDNPNRIAPWAMNIGIKEAKGDVIMRRMLMQPIRTIISHPWLMDLASMVLIILVLYVDGRVE